MCWDSFYREEYKNCMFRGLHKEEQVSVVLSNCTFFRINVFPLFEIPLAECRMLGRRESLIRMNLPCVVHRTVLGGTLARAT